MDGITLPPATLEHTTDYNRRWPVHPVSLLYQQLALSFKEQVKPYMPRKTKDEAEQTRLSIMQAAIEVFNDKGVSRSTLADIAAEAGVTRGAIYWHFDNKTDLVHQMMSHYFDGIDQQIREQHSGLQGVEMLEKAVNSWVGIIEEREDIQKLLEISFFKMEHTGDMSALHEIESNILQSDISQLVSDLQHNVQTGEIRADADLTKASISFIALSQGILMQWILLKKTFSLRSVLISSIEALLNDIRVK